MKQSPMEQKISELIDHPINGLGYNVVRVRIHDQGGKTLQILAERQSDRELNIDDCAKISRTISAILDVEDPIKDEYNLEVSSPGIDRPLIRAHDFEDFSGNEIKLTTCTPIDGRRRYRGMLLGLNTEKNALRIKLEDLPDETVIAVDNVEDAKLILTDKLIADHQKKHGDLV